MNDFYKLEDTEVDLWHYLLENDRKLNHKQIKMIY